MSTVHFSVNNQLQASVNRNVLVFLVPEEATEDYQFAAWQNLHIGTGGSEPFDYNIDIAVVAVDSASGSTSQKVSISPGQVFDVVDDNAGGIVLQSDPDTSRVTHSQCGVINNLNPARFIDLIWIVNGGNCCTVPNLNQGDINTFELKPKLWFYAAAPPIEGQNYKLQSVSLGTQYTIPVGNDAVTVDWSRPGGQAGQDTFAFAPPSSSTVSDGSSFRTLRTHAVKSAQSRR